MAGQRRLHGDLGGFEVADFADHDDVRVLAQDGAQQMGEIEADLRLDLDLVDAGQAGTRSGPRWSTTLRVTELSPSRPV